MVPRLLLLVYSALPKSNPAPVSLFLRGRSANLLQPAKQCRASFYSPAKEEKEVNFLKNMSWFRTRVPLTRYAVSNNDWGVK